MAIGLIKKNFSNYSAWHYRAKLMPRLYTEQKALAREEENKDSEDNQLNYLIPFKQIQDDLSLLKHAFFTDPKD